MTGLAYFSPEHLKSVQVHEEYRSYNVARARNVIVEGGRANGRIPCQSRIQMSWPSSRQYCRNFVVGAYVAVVYRTQTRRWKTSCRRGRSVHSKRRVVERVSCRDLGCVRLGAVRVVEEDARGPREQIVMAHILDSILEGTVWPGTSDVMIVASNGTIGMVTLCGGSLAATR